MLPNLDGLEARVLVPAFQRELPLEAAPAPYLRVQLAAVLAEQDYVTQRQGLVPEEKSKSASDVTAGGYANAKIGAALAVAAVAAAALAMAGEAFVDRLLLALQSSHFLLLDFGVAEMRLKLT